MSLLKIQTKALTGLLSDLVLTSSEEEMPSAGVLLHTARGYADPTEPGETDLLVGTSSNGFQCGHTFVAAAGQAPAMLWPIGDAQVVLATFKAKSRGHKEHSVDIKVDGDHITVAEDPNLFGETSVSFTARPLDDYPRDLWQVMDGDKHVDLDTDPMPRTDVGAHALAVLAKISRHHGAPIEMYRFHQRRPVLVQIGATYRGAVMPQRWDRDSTAGGDSPSTDLYVPDLPDPDEVA